MPDYVLVVPCYNEAARWNDTYWQPLLKLQGIHWLFVDDGSTDETLKLAQRVSAEGSGETIRVHRNGGKAEAVRFGLNCALDSEKHGTAGVGFMDADGAFDASDVRRLLAVSQQLISETGQVDAVWSSRVALAGRDIRRSAFRHYLGRGVSTLVSLGQSNMPYDTQSGLKVFAPTDTLRDCLRSPFLTRWLFEIELLSRWHSSAKSPMRIWEEPVGSWTEVPGSKITGRECARIARELYLVKRQQARVANLTSLDHSPANQTSNGS